MVSSCRDMKKPVTPPFEIAVPPGTVVKRKGTGALLGELIHPGEWHTHIHTHTLTYNTAQSCMYVCTDIVCMQA